MKNTIKVLGIIALVAVIGFSMVSCNNDGGGETVTATVLSSSSWDEGEGVKFELTSSIGSCTVTTDLPAPNDKFTLNKDNKEKFIPTGTSVTVNFTITITSGSLGTVQGRGTRDSITIYLVDY